MLPLRQPVQPLGAEQLRLLQFQSAPLIRPVSAPLRAAIPACIPQRVLATLGARRRRGTPAQGSHADHRPAGSARSRIGFADQSRVVHLLGTEVDVFKRQGAQLEGIRARARPATAPSGSCTGVPPGRFVSRREILVWSPWFANSLRSSSPRAVWRCAKVGSALISSSLGCSGCLVSISARPSRPNALNRSFTFRSSLDMKLITTIRPPLFSKSGPISSNRSNSPGSSLTAIRKAMNVFVAGCKRPVLGTARDTTSARCSVLLYGPCADDCSGYLPRPPFFA